MSDEVKTEDVVMTPEMLEKVGAFLAIQPDAEFKYTPKVYREKDNEGNFLIDKSQWPVFIIRGLDGIEATMNEDRMEVSYGVEDDKLKSSSMKLNSGAIKIETCKKGIVSWRNFRDARGKLVQTPSKDQHGALKDLDIRRLSPSLITELANAITEQSRLTEEEERGLE